MYATTLHALAETATACSTLLHDIVLRQLAEYGHIVKYAWLGRRSEGYWPMMFHRICKRTYSLDWETLYCPNRSCRFYGIPWRQSAMVKNGTSYGQKQALCRACGRSVYLREGTAYFELDTDPA